MGGKNCRNEIREIRDYPRRMLFPSGFELIAIEANPLDSS